MGVGEWGGRGANNQEGVQFQEVGSEPGFDLEMIVQGEKEVRNKDMKDAEGQMIRGSTDGAVEHLRTSEGDPRF